MITLFKAVVRFFMIITLTITSITYGKAGQPDSARSIFDFIKGDSIRKAAETGSFEISPLMSADRDSVDLYKTKYAKAYYAYYTQSFDHTAKVFNWQYYSSILIFIIVIGIVVSGMYFSAIQFYHSLGRYSAKTKIGEGEIIREASTSQDIEISASPTAVSIKTSLVGIAILFISLLFFYLYLTIVYPISPIGSVSTKGNAVETSNKLDDSSK